MKPVTIHPRFRRRLPYWGAALLALLFAGTGVAVADDDSDRQGRYSDEHRTHDDGYAVAGHRGHRYDRDRHRHRHGNSCSVDRHRRHDRQYRHDRGYNRYDRNSYYRHRSRDRYYNDHRYDRQRYRHRRFDIPRAIAHSLLHTYKPYHHGRVYYSQHRHHHDIYRFPVYNEYGVEYYPYSYCEGSFFARGHFRDGRAVFDLRIGF